MTKISSHTAMAKDMFHNTSKSLGMGTIIYPSYFLYIIIGNDKAYIWAPSNSAIAFVDIDIY